MYNSKHQQYPRLSLYQGSKACASPDKTTIYKKYPSDSPGREAKKISAQLGEINTGSQDSQSGFRLRHSVLSFTKTKQTASRHQSKYTTKKNDGDGSGRNADEGSYKASDKYQRSVSKQYIFSNQKVWGQQTSNKSEKSEFFHPLSTLQNGRSTFTKRKVEGRRFHVQTRPEGCILLFPFMKTRRNL